MEAIVGDWRDGRALAIDGTTRHLQLSSARFFADRWSHVEQHIQAGGKTPVRFEGAVALAAPASWACAPQEHSYSFSFWPTVQPVVVHFGPGFDAAIARFGLSAHALSLRSGVLQGCRDAFVGLAVTCDDSAHVDVDAIGEAVVVIVGNDDPNGLGLLGRDATVGKDDGNRFLGELLGGKNAAAARRGSAPHGGVFVGELFIFSRKLNPTVPLADPAFDALFGPYAPALGGVPAAPGDDAQAAVKALASLITDTLVHEVGHALGLAAGTPGFHHEQDNPGWRMDAGKNRPFAERAGLEGAAVWGPIDGAYLAKFLPVQ